jgi:hypothetical protein
LLVQEHQTQAVELTNYRCYKNDTLTMRILLPSLLAGFLAIGALTGLPYLFDSRGDSHIGPSIYLFWFAGLSVSHLFGIAMMFGAWRWRRSAPLRGINLPIVVLVTLVGYSIAFTLLVRLVFGFWVWQATWAMLTPCLIVGLASLSVFAFSSRIRAVKT